MIQLEALGTEGRREEERWEGRREEKDGASGQGERFLRGGPNRRGEEDGGGEKRKRRRKHSAAEPMHALE